MGQPGLAASIHRNNDARDMAEDPNAVALDIQRIVTALGDRDALNAIKGDIVTRAGLATLHEAIKDETDFVKKKEIADGGKSDSTTVATERGLVLQAKSVEELDAVIPTLTTKEAMETARLQLGALQRREDAAGKDDPKDESADLDILNSATDEESFKALLGQLKTKKGKDKWAETRASLAKGQGKDIFGGDLPEDPIKRALAVALLGDRVGTGAPKPRNPDAIQQDSISLVESIDKEGKTEGFLSMTGKIRPEGGVPEAKRPAFRAWLKKREEAIQNRDNPGAVREEEVRPARRVPVVWHPS